MENVPTGETPLQIENLSTGGAERGYPIALPYIVSVVIGFVGVACILGVFTVDTK